MASTPQKNCSRSTISQSRSFRLQGKTVDAAVGCRAPKVDQEKMAAVFVRQPDARVIRQPGRTFRNMRQRWHHVGRLPVPRQLPEPFVVPRPAIGQVLIVHPPAAVGPVDNVDPACQVDAVRSCCRP